MTTQEFSHEFDVLYNNITNGVSPGVNEYEKSVFLTKAQLEFVQSTIMSDTTTDGVDSDTLTKHQLKPLYERKECKINDSSIQNSLYILNTMLQVTKDNGITTTVPVVPISYDTAYKVLNNPFFKSSYRDYQLESSDIPKIYYKGNLIEGDQYTLIIDYIRYPKPIILENLEEGFTVDSNIDGFYDGNGYTEQTSELPESTHFGILKNAIQLALVTNGVTQS